MKKILVLSLMLGLLLVGCKGNDPTENQNVDATNAASESQEEATTQAGQSLEDIKKQGYITMGTSAEYPPYEWHDIDGSKDEIIGVDIEIAKAIADDLGVELKIKDMQFDGLLAALNANEMDFVIAGMAATDERREAVDFSDPYTSQEQLLVVRAEDADKYKTMDDLKDIVLGVQLGSTQESFAKENFEKNGVTVNGLPDNNNIIMELKNGTFDAVFLSGIPANKFADMHKELKVVDIQAPPEDAYSIAIKKGNAELVEQINKTLTKLNENDQVKAWEKEYFELSTDK